MLFLYLPPKDLIHPPFQMISVDLIRLNLFMLVIASVANALTTMKGDREWSTRIRWGLHVKEVYTGNFRDSHYCKGSKMNN